MVTRGLFLATWGLHSHSGSLHGHLGLLDGHLGSPLFRAFWDLGKATKGFCMATWELKMITFGF